MGGPSPPCCPFNASCTVGRDDKISMSLSARSVIEWWFRFGEEGNGRDMMSVMRKANPNYVLSASDQTCQVPGAGCGSFVCCGRAILQ